METPTMPYNEQALRVLELTKEEARTLNHNFIGTEHLLLGILREGSGARELIDQGVTYESIRGGILFILEGYVQGTPNPNPGFTLRAQNVLVLAGKEAQLLGKTAIGPRDLLVAILREGQGIAAQLLQVSGVQLEEVEGMVRIVRVPEVDEGPIVVPTDFQEALEQDPAARSLFEKLSNSKKKSFVDRIEQAEGEAARKQQVEKAIEYLQKIHQFHQQRQQ